MNQRYSSLTLSMKKSKSHRMRLNNEPKTAKDFYDWITIQRIEVEEKFGSCIIANCGIIR